MKKLILHKHKGSELAFNLLVSKDMSKQLRFKQFQGLMKYFAAERGKFFGQNKRRHDLHFQVFFEHNIFLDGLEEDNTFGIWCHIRIMKLF